METNSAANEEQRKALRRRLRAARESFAGSTEADAAQRAVERHLAQVLHALEPQVLGLYWPVRGEFSAVALWREDEYLSSVPASLPFTRRQPPAMPGH